ncbi:MAG: hypothetical protein L6R40_005878 [Gallowayella cf. fulva]|nr:MAG: hypothetical protein L6R40_005878 [Xanthomendoza cf. fulva]
MTTTTHGPTDTTTPIFPIFPIFPISPISPISLISTTTLISLLSTLTLLLAAIFLSRSLLPSPALRTHHLLLPLHTWHLFDFLIHTLLEGSFLYHSFFSYTTLLPHDPPPPSDYPHPASLRTPSTNANSASFLGHSNRRYGAEHSAWPTARLWQEYARADKRWANTDTNIISIELLTVFVAAPLALYICHLLQHQSSPSSSSSLPPPPQRPSRNPNIVKPHSQPMRQNYGSPSSYWRPPKSTAAS